VQNINAAKFRLKELDNLEIRYEVIYKNLLRDIRRYYKAQFSDNKDLESGNFGALDLV